MTEPPRDVRRLRFELGIRLQVLGGELGDQRLALGCARAEEPGIHPRREVALRQDTTRTLAAFTHVDAAGAYAYWMGTKTAKQVDFKRLADALDGYRFAYLVTVDDDYRVHTVTVEPELREGVMDVGLIGGKTRKNVATRSDVTLLWPPSEPSGYSLIVDGRAEVTESDDDTARLRVVPTRALLHRNADPGTLRSPKDYLHDCVVFSEPQTFV